MPYQTRPSLPARCASLPPLHLEFPPQSRVGLSCLPKDEGHFPWARLPKELQLDILRSVLPLPKPTQDARIIFGGQEHKAHLSETAVPLFLGLGNWDAYIEAASVLYHTLCIEAHFSEKAISNLLSSSHTLRVRKLIRRLEFHLFMTHYFDLFDVRLSSTNIPIALDMMRVHGQLRQLDFFIYFPDVKNSCGLYLPMAHLQTADSSPSSLWPERHSTVYPPTAARAAEPGKVVIAPKLFASQAFQSGFLPLLESGAFPKTSVSLRLIIDRAEYRNIKLDGHSIFKYWFGATFVGDAPSQLSVWTLGKENGIDLMPFFLLDVDYCGVPAQADEDGDQSMVDVAEPGDTVEDAGTAAQIDIADYRERGDDLLSSPLQGPELLLNSDASLPSQNLVEALHNMVARTSVEVAAKDEASRNQDNAATCKKGDNSMDGQSSSSSSSDALSTFSNGVEAVSFSTSGLASDAAETVDTDMTTNSSQYFKEEISEPVCPMIAEPMDTVAEEDASKGHEADVTHEAVSCDVDAVDLKPTNCTNNLHLTGSNGSEAKSLEDTIVVQTSQNIEETIVASGCIIDEHPLDAHSDSDNNASDDSADEYPPSRSAAFAKKTPSPRMILILTTEANNSDVSSSSHDTDDTEMDIDSSSSEDESDPRSPTIEISRQPGESLPIEDSSFVMTGALPSSDLDSSSSSDNDSDSDSEGSSDTSSDSDDSSSDEEGKLSSRTLFQVGEVLGARAASENTAPCINEKKVMRTVNALSISKVASGPKARKVDYDTSSSTSDSDISSSESDDESSSDTSGDDDAKPCPNCAWKANKSQSEKDKGKNKIPAQPRKTAPVKSKVSPPNQASGSLGGTPSSRSSGGSGPPTRQNNSRGSNTANMPHNPNKRKAPPRSTNTTPLSKRQIRIRNWAQRRRNGQHQAAQN